MKQMLFHILSEFDLTLPYHIVGVGTRYEQEHIVRPKGFPQFQWIQCRSGCGELILDGTTHMVSENQGMLLFPGVPHEYHAVGGEWEVDWIIFHGAGIAPFFSNTKAMQSSGVFFVSQPHSIADKIREIYTIEHSDSTMKSIDCSRLVYGILMDLLKYASEKVDNSMSHRFGRLKLVFAYIDAHCGEAITLPELAQVAGITPQHLCNSFRKMTTHTLTEYINMTRIKKGKELIMQNRLMPLKEIAGRIGFNDVSYFCSTFRKYAQMSPSEFRGLLG